MLQAILKIMMMMMTVFMQKWDLFFFAMIIMNIRMDSIVECYTVTNMFLLCYIDDHFFARYIPLCFLLSTDGRSNEYLCMEENDC